MTSESSGCPTCGSTTGNPNKKKSTFSDAKKIEILSLLLALETNNHTTSTVTNAKALKYFPDEGWNEGTFKNLVSQIKGIGKERVKEHGGIPVNDGKDAEGAAEGKGKMKAEKGEGAGKKGEKGRGKGKKGKAAAAASDNGKNSEEAGEAEASEPARKRKRTEEKKEKVKPEQKKEEKSCEVDEEGQYVEDCKKEEKKGDVDVEAGAGAAIAEGQGEECIEAC